MGSSVNKTCSRASVSGFRSQQHRCTHKKKSPSGPKVKMLCDAGLSVSLPQYSRSITANDILEDVASRKTLGKEVNHSRMTAPSTIAVLPDGGLDVPAGTGHSPLAVVIVTSALATSRARHWARTTHSAQPRSPLPSSHVRDAAPVTVEQQEQAAAKSKASLLPSPAGGHEEIKLKRKLAKLR